MTEHVVRHSGSARYSGSVARAMARGAFVVCAWTVPLYAASSTRADDAAVCEMGGEDSLACYPNETETTAAVAAKLDGETITLAQIDDEVLHRPLYREMLDAYRNSIEFRSGFRPKVLEAMVGARLLAKAARASGKVSESDVREIVAELLAEARGGTRAQSHLGLLGDPESAAYKRQLGDDVRVKLYLDEVFAAVRVTDDDVTALYKKSRDLARRHQKVRASSIGVLVPKGSTPEEIALAKNKIDRLHWIVQQPGVSFSEVAYRESEMPNARFGGFMGAVPYGRHGDKFEEVIADMKEGELSAPFMSDLGFQFIKLHKRLGPVVPPLEEARPALVEILAERKRFEAMAAIVSEELARSRLEVTLHDFSLSNVAETGRRSEAAEEHVLRTLNNEVNEVSE